ncbi:MAG: TPM domain-containing protein [Sphingobium sp.]
MARIRISKADHDRITQAVHAAERHSDAEIVTVVAPRSDAYHDVGLHYALAAMLCLLALVAAFPYHFSQWVTGWLGGWDHAVPLGLHLALLLAAQIILFLAVRYALAWPPLRLALTPQATRSRRVRRQAVTLFRACAEGRTQGRTAILLYLSMAEHRAEIVADESISRAVAPERWGDAMAALVDHARRGDPATGMVEAIGLIGVILAEYLPNSDSNPNELSDRLIEL